MLPDDEDPLFLERLKRRDEAAFNVLVRLHQAVVYRMLLRMLGDAAEAEDVAQDVFVTVFKAIEGFRGESKLSTWIHRIAVNHGRNRLKYQGRRRRAGQKVVDENTEPTEASPALHGRVVRPDQAVESQQAQDHVQTALSSLNEEQRTLIVLRDLEHLSYEELQEVTGLPSGTVKSRLHRARMALHVKYTELSEGKK